jgi:hypothetical protein
MAQVLAAVSVLSLGISPAADWTLVPGLRAGPMTGNTSEAELGALYGQQNVVPSEIELGEGLTERGTVLFPDDPRRKAEILWVSRDRRKIRTLRITEKGTLWKTDRGVTIGTSLKALSRLNQRPLTLVGFAWDYGGTIVDCNGGSLKELGTHASGGLEGRTLVLRVSPDQRWRGSREYGSVTGDREFSSDHPAMKEMNPIVYSMTMGFGPI